MQSDAQKRAQDKYNKKRVVVSTTFRENDMNEYIRLKKYLETSELSVNSYLKDLIKRDLDSKGITYD